MKPEDNREDLAADKATVVVRRFSAADRARCDCAAQLYCDLCSARWEPERPVAKSLWLLPSGPDQVGDDHVRPTPAAHMPGSGGEIKPASAADAHHLADALDMVALTNRFTDLLGMPAVGSGKRGQRGERGSRDAHGGSEGSDFHIGSLFSSRAAEHAWIAELALRRSKPGTAVLPANRAADADLVVTTPLPVAHAAGMMSVPALMAFAVAHDGARYDAVVMLRGRGDWCERRGGGEACREDQLHFHRVRSFCCLEGTGA